MQHRAAGASPLILSLQLEGSRLAAFLTDGGSLFVSQSAQVDAQGLSPAALERYVAGGAAASAATGVATGGATGAATGADVSGLYRALLPESIRAALAGAPAAQLRLQLAEDLAAVPWELLGDDGMVLGARHAVSRQVRGDAARVVADPQASAHHVPAAPAAEGGRRTLRVLRIRDGRIDDAIGDGHAGTPSDDGAPAEIPPIELARGEGPRPARASPARLTPRLPHEYRCDVLDLAGDWSGLSTLLSHAGADELPRLVTIGATPGAEIHALAGGLKSRGIALLVYPSPPAPAPASSAPASSARLSGSESASESASSAPVDWLAAVCRHWEAGGHLSEAVRQVRLRAIADGQRCPLLALYGDCWRPSFASPGPPPVQDGFRQVTALSFDLVESTRLLHRIGGERYSQMLAEFHDCCLQVVSRFGGVSDDPQGDDGIMNYFGFPAAVEGSALNAVRAGLAMIESVALLGLQIRVGVSTGRVAIKAGQPVGLSVHLAARLREVGEPDTLLICDTTRSLVQTQVEFEPVDRVPPLKGIDVAPLVHRVLGLRVADAPHGRVFRDLSRFVGREAELEQLLAQWEYALEGRGQLALLTGDAGIGKSRLLREFRVNLQRRNHAIVEVRCSVDGAASAFHALGNMLREFFRISTVETPQEQFARIGRTLPPQLSRVDPIAHTLIASLVFPARAGLAPLPTVGLRERMLLVLCEWLRLEAQRAPLCLVIDDLQWIDPSTRELLTRLFERHRSLPLFVVMTVRNENDNGWRPDCRYETLALKGLSQQAALELVESVCGETRLPPALVERLVQRADGVPLFLEESVRMAMEADRADPALPPSHQSDVPATIYDLLMARLDRIGPAKVVAQWGAVLGREFSEAMLAAVMESASDNPALSDAGRLLDTLVGSGLLLRKKADGAVSYRFKHALVRDTAYMSLWIRDRRAIHARVAMVLRERFADLVRQQPELLAQHLTEAGSDELAVQAWDAAARQAAKRSAFRESIDLAKTALGIIARLPRGAARDRAELRMHMLLASCGMATEGYGARKVGLAYERAAQLCAELGDARTRMRVDLGLGAHNFMRGDFVRALQNARQILDAPAESTDQILKLQAEWATAVVLWHQGDVRLSIAHMDRCLAQYRPEMHRVGAAEDPGVLCLGYSAWGHWELGQAGEALQRVERALALARSLDHPRSQAEAMTFAANVHFYCGDLDRAEACASEAERLCETNHIVTWFAQALILGGRIRVQRGQVQAGLERMAQGYERWLQTGAVVTRPLFLALRADALLLAGQPLQAIGLLKQALYLAQSHGERYQDAEILRLQGEALLQAAPDGTEAARLQAGRLFLDALDVAGRQHKRAFALRAAMSLARLHSVSGAHPEALAMLARAIDDMPDAGMTQDWKDAGLLLADLRACG